MFSSPRPPPHRPSNFQSLAKSHFIKWLTERKPWTIIVIAIRLAEIILSVDDLQMKIPFDLKLIWLNRSYIECVNINERMRRWIVHLNKARKKPHVVISRDIIKWMEWIEKIATVATININATGKCCRKQDLVVLFFCNASKTFIAYGKMVIHIFVVVVRC